MRSTKTRERQELVVEDDVPMIIHHKPADQRDEQPSKARRRGRPGRLTGVFVWTFASLSGLALWFLFHALVLTAFQEQGSQARLYAQLRERLASETAPLGGRIKPGSPVAIIDTPNSSLRDLVVVEGTSAEQLMLGPGHLPNSPLPGQLGISTVFGKSVTYGAPFRSLARLKPGDTITATTAQGVFHYRVDRLRKAGAPTPPLYSNESRLTLITSASNGWRSGWAPDHAIFLDATLIGQPKPAPPGRPTTVAKNARPMKGDPSVQPLLIAWVSGFFLLSGCFAWAWRRWNHWQLWLAGVPIMMAVLWGASGAGLRFLPNLI